MAKKKGMSRGTKVLVAFGLLFALQGIALATMGRKRAA